MIIRRTRGKNNRKSGTALTTESYDQLMGLEKYALKIPLLESYEEKHKVSRLYIDADLSVYRLPYPQ